MAGKTNNYNLEKQQLNDYINIEGINENLDVIDGQIKNISDKADQAFQKASNPAIVNGHKVEADVPLDAKFTDTVYTHPTTHPPEIIAQNSSNRFVSDTEKAAWNSKQVALGFTPVQQGTGAGQLSNTIKIGWSGSRLKATVDSTDLGNFAFGDIPSSLPANGGNADTVNGMYIIAQTAIPTILGNGVICLVYE